MVGVYVKTRVIDNRAPPNPCTKHRWVPSRQQDREPPVHSYRYDNDTSKDPMQQRPSAIHNNPLPKRNFFVLKNPPNTRICSARSSRETLCAGVVERGTAFRMHRGSVQGLSRFGNCCCCNNNFVVVKVVLLQKVV